MKAQSALVYVGICLPTGKAYVGSTGKRPSLIIGATPARINSHRRRLAKNVHDNDYLQKAWNKYGSENFAWAVLEYCSMKERLIREQWWVEFFRAGERSYGFNLCYPVANSAPTKSHLSRSQKKSWKGADKPSRDKRLGGLVKLFDDEDWKGRRAAAMKARWANREWRAKMEATLKKNSDELKRRRAEEPGFSELQTRGIRPYMIPMKDRPKRIVSNEIV